MRKSYLLALANLPYASRLLEDQYHRHILSPAFGSRRHLPPRTSIAFPPYSCTVVTIHPRIWEAHKGLYTSLIPYPREAANPDDKSFSIRRRIYHPNRNPQWPPSLPRSTSQLVRILGPASDAIAAHLITTSHHPSSSCPRSKCTFRGITDPRRTTPVRLVKDGRIPPTAQPYATSTPIFNVYFTAEGCFRLTPHPSRYPFSLCLCRLLIWTTLLGERSIMARPTAAAESSSTALSTYDDTCFIERVRHSTLTSEVVSWNGN